MTIIVVPTTQCNFRCSYCLSGDSRILMEDWTWKPIKDIEVGERVIGYDKRKIEVTEVTQTFQRRDILFQLKTETGELYLTEEHPILTRYGRWRHIGQKPVQVGKEVKKSVDVIEVQQTEDFKIGYLTGAIHGDGTLKTYQYQREWGMERVYRFRFVVKDVEFYERVKQYLTEFEIDFNEYDFDINGTTVSAIYRNSKEHYDIICQLTEIANNPSSEWLRGFVSGMFDAEGSIDTQSTARMSNTDDILLSKYIEGLNRFGFNHITEKYKGGIKTIRIRGGLREKIRFVTLFDLAITRKKNKLLGHQLNSYEKIESITKQNVDDVYNLETELGNYIAEGFIVHNCFEPEAQRIGENVPLNVDAMKRALIDVWAGPYQGSDICLHGGEFTMVEREVLEELMEFVFGFKGKVNIVTNGSLVDDDIVEMFKKYNVSIGVSCDGPPALNVLRGPAPEDEDITLKYNVELNDTIQKLKQEGLPVSIMCILHTMSAGDSDRIDMLKNWMTDLAKMGIKGGRMNLMYGNPEYELTPRQAATAWLELYEHNKKEELDWNPFKEMEKNLQGEKLSPCVFNQCDIFNTKTLSILPDGSVANCDRTFSEGIYLRSYSDKPSGRYKALEQTDCRGCRYWTICAGSCPMEGIDDDWRRKTRFCDAIYALYSQIERDLGREGGQVKLGVAPPVSPTAHGDETHGDSGHGDSTHGDKTHGDSTHGDSGHGDSGHGDSGHGDQPHGDSSHDDAPDWKMNRETLRWDKGE